MSPPSYMASYIYIDLNGEVVVLTLDLNGKICLF